MKLRAFTLAEILIALVIIGVLLRVLIPTFSDNMNKKTMVITLQKVYLNISDNVQRLLIDERTRSVANTYLFKSSGLTVDSSAGAFVKQYSKITTDCGTKKAPCLAESYVSLDKSKNITLPSDGDVYCVAYSNHASVCISPLKSGSNGVVYVDVNGVKKPNIAGRDLFVFYIYPDGFVGDRSDNANECASSAEAVGCFNKLVKSDWKMEY